MTSSDLYNKDHIIIRELDSSEKLVIKKIVNDNGEGLNFIGRDTPLIDINSYKNACRNLAIELGYEYDSEKINNDELVNEFFSELKKLFEANFKPSLEEKCPGLKDWSSDRAERRARGLTKKVVDATEEKQAPLEGAHEFLMRTLREANVTKVPYIHEIRQVNIALADALYKQQHYQGSNLGIPSKKKR